MFKRTRLDDDPSSAKCHDKTTKQRLKTFSTISTKTSRMKGQNVVLKADRNLFCQMILVAENRCVNKEDVLAHPLGPLLWALANVAALAKELETRLFMHLIRPTYQAATWKCCTHARPTVPNPTKCVWIDDDGNLAIHWMRSPPATSVGLQVCPFL